jgi:hypothetical protein
MNEWRLGDNIGGKWLWRVIDRRLLGPLVELIAEYVDCTNLFWIRQYDACLLMSPVSTVPIITQIHRTNDDKFDIMIHGQEQFSILSDRSPKTKEIRIGNHDSYTNSIVSRVIPWDIGQIICIASVKGMSDLIIPITEDWSGRTRFHVYNFVSRTITLQPDCGDHHMSNYLLNFAARVDVKTGDVLIGAAGIDRKPHAVIWRYSIITKRLWLSNNKIVNMSRQELCKSVIVDVVLANNFFAAVAFHCGHMIQSWTYGGMPLPTYYGDCCDKCRLFRSGNTIVSNNDTIYMLRLEYDKDSYWVSWNPLSAKTTHGPARIHKDIPKVIPQHVTVAGQFLIEHYPFHSLLVLTHIHNLTIARTFTLS